MLATMLNSRLALLTADADIHEEFRKVHARLDNLEREWKKIREDQQHAAVSLTHAVVRNGAAAMPPAPAALLNAGANCWDGCNSRQGACSTGFCGAQGVCCRVGFANSPVECGFMGSAGCKSSHCCTLPAKPAKAGGAMGFSADSAVMYAPCSTRFPHKNKGGRYCCQSPTGCATAEMQQKANALQQRYKGVFLTNATLRAHDSASLICCVHALILQYTFSDT